jgi:hypothetical protein
VRSYRDKSPKPAIFSQFFRKSRINWKPRAFDRKDMTSDGLSETRLESNLIIFAAPKKQAKEQIIQVFDGKTLNDTTKRLEHACGAV